MTRLDDQGDLSQTHSPPSVKQNLATIRMLFDWMITGQVVELNPAHTVGGPKHVVKKCKTPVLNEDEALDLLQSIEVSNLVDLRDRALVAVCLYSFARIEAALGMSVCDYFSQGKLWWFRLHEKGGKQHNTPAHHKDEEFADTYVEAAGLKNQKNALLLRSAISKTKQLNEKRMSRHAGPEDDPAPGEEGRDPHHDLLPLLPDHRDHALPRARGTLEKAQQMAVHEPPKTTKLYDRTDDAMTLDEVERIAI